MEGALKQAESEVNTSAPFMVDEATRLERASVDGNRISYHYTLIQYSADEIDFNATQGTLKSRVRSAVCTSDEMKAFREHRVDMEYIYSDKNGVRISSFVINAGECS